MTAEQWLAFVITPVFVAAFGWLVAFLYVRNRR
jgi:hypothetical protein